MEPTTNQTGQGSTPMGGGQGDQGQTPVNPTPATPTADASFTPPWLNFQPAESTTQGSAAGTTASTGTQDTTTAPEVTMQEQNAPVVPTEPEHDVDPFINPFDMDDEEELHATEDIVHEEPAPVVETPVFTPSAQGSTSTELLQNFLTTMKNEEKEYHATLEDIHQEMKEEDLRHEEAKKDLEKEKQSLKAEHRKKMDTYKDILRQLQDVILGPKPAHQHKNEKKGGEQQKTAPTPPAQEDTEISDSFLSA